MTYEERERERSRKWLKLALERLPLEKLKLLAEHACWYLDQECGKEHYVAYYQEKHGARWRW
jgi:hypothetical protein